MRSAWRLIPILLLAACHQPASKPAPSPTPEATPAATAPARQWDNESGLQADRWNAAELNAKDSIRLDKAVQLYGRHVQIYRHIQAMRKNGVPAMILFGLHYRESDNDFTANPAQGDPLTHKSIHVPRGRIPGVNPPYTFEQAAEDAYYTVDHLDRKDWTRLDTAMDGIEGFNGMGYRKRGIPSPYLWAGTSVYSRGKFVADGRFSATALDAQLGVAAILKQMEKRNITLPFSP